MELLEKNERNILCLIFCTIYIVLIFKTVWSADEWGKYENGLIQVKLYEIERVNLAEKYRDYLKMFNKSYEDVEETKWRFEVFKKSLQEIDRLNNIGDAKYGWTKFSDVTYEEMFRNGYETQKQPKVRRRHNKNGHRHNKNRQKHKQNKHGQKNSRRFGLHKKRFVCDAKFEAIENCPDDMRGIYNDTNIPEKVDWREKRMVGPVLNQKQCNGCWAFSIVGVIESMAVIQGIESEIVSRSIQELLDCREYTTESGCKYGSVLKHLRYMCNNNISVVKDVDYPLTLFDETCRLDGTPTGRRLACFNSKKNIDENDLLRLLAFHGPVITVVNSTPWLYYLDGVIRESCQRGLKNRKLHVVQIVGYDTTPVYPDVPYYIVRNSWGDDFGINGYVKLGMYGNICGLADEIYYLMVD